MNLKNEFTKGIIKENPVLISLLGMCPTLAVTSSVDNALGMSLAVIAVLTASNIVVSLMRKIIPDSIRIPSFIVIIATFVTAIEMTMHAFLPDLYRALGIFLPLIVVNCIILGRAEAFASKNGILKSIADALGMGLGFTLALFILSSVREIIGAGSFMGISLFGEAFQPALIMILPPGAFIALGGILGIMNYFRQRDKKCAVKGAKS